jgi:tRNA pseudouridine32 synthase/23S rRNA pseudouridine746 synthase
MSLKDTSLEDTSPKDLPPGAMSPEAMLARVLYRDGLMLVIDKPAGMAVHRGKDTSGCLVLGRHRKALAHLGLLFKHGKVAKTYWAVVEGHPDRDEGVIDLPLGRLDETRGWWMKPDPKGLPSVTTWKVMGRSGAAGEGAGQRADEVAGKGATATAGRGPLAWLALTPVTGRTHQLRVHCAASGWPIVGDNIYGTAPRFGGPVMQLHAREISVPISRNKAPVRVVAPVPAHMRERLAACGWNGADDGSGARDDALHATS